MERRVNKNNHTIQLAETDSTHLPAPDRILPAMPVDLQTATWTSVAEALAGHLYARLPCKLNSI